MRIIIVAADVLQPTQAVQDEITEVGPEDYIEEPVQPPQIAPAPAPTTPAVPVVPEKPVSKYPELRNPQALTTLVQQYIRTSLADQDVEPVIQKVLELQYMDGSTIRSQLPKIASGVMPEEVVWFALRSKTNEIKKKTDKGIPLDQALMTLRVDPGYFFRAAWNLRTGNLQAESDEGKSQAKVTQEAKHLESYLARFRERADIDPDILQSFDNRELSESDAVMMQFRRGEFKDNIDPISGEPIVDPATGEYNKPEYAPKYDDQGDIVVPAKTRTSIAYKELWKDADQILLNSGTAQSYRQEMEDMARKELFAAQADENARAQAEGRNPQQITKLSPEQVNRINRHKKEKEGELGYCDAACAARIWMELDKKFLGGGKIIDKKTGLPKEKSYSSYKRPLFKVTPEGKVVPNSHNIGAGKESKQIGSLLLKLLSKASPERAQKYNDPESKFWLTSNMMAEQQPSKKSVQSLDLKKEIKEKKKMGPVVSPTDMPVETPLEGFGEEGEAAPQEPGGEHDWMLREDEQGIEQLPAADEGSDLDTLDTSTPSMSGGVAAKTPEEVLERTWSTRGDEQQLPKLKQRLPILTVKDKVEPVMNTIMQSLYGVGSPPLNPSLNMANAFVKQRDAFTKSALRIAAMAYVEGLTGDPKQPETMRRVKQQEADLKNLLNKANAQQLLILRHLSEDEIDNLEDASVTALADIMRYEMRMDMMSYILDDRNFSNLKSKFGKKVAETVRHMIRTAAFISASRRFVHMAYGA